MGCGEKGSQEQGRARQGKAVVPLRIAYFMQLNDFLSSHFPTPCAISFNFTQTKIHASLTLKGFACYAQLHKLHVEMKMFENLMNIFRGVK